MLRYARLYAYFLRFSFSRAMEFRFDFFFRIVMDVVWYVVNLAFFRTLYLHTDLLGGWSREQMVVFLATLFLADALNMSIFANNMWWFPVFVNRGDLDYYLTRPVSSLFFLSLRDFAANSFVNLVMTVAFLGWVLGTYPAPLPAGNLACYGAMVVLGLLVHYLLQLVFLVPVFWMHQGAGLREISWALNRYSHYPDGIFHGWARRLLTGILPFALIASFPTRALFAAEPLPLLGHMVAVVAGLGVVASALWARGLRSYSSASS